MTSPILPTLQFWELRTSLERPSEDGEWIRRQDFAAYNFAVADYLLQAKAMILSLQQDFTEIRLRAVELEAEVVTMRAKLSSRGIDT